MNRLVFCVLAMLLVSTPVLADDHMTGESPEATPAAAGASGTATDMGEPEVTADEMPAAGAETMPEPEPAKGTVARAVFTTAVVDREPVDQITTADQNMQTVYFFTELRDMEGQTVTHRWLYNGSVMAEVSFEVGGVRWRVYSSKNFVPEWVGQWTVEVVDSDGRVRESADLDYVAAR